jgi:hypothetical protein
MAVAGLDERAVWPTHKDARDVPGGVAQGKPADRHPAQGGRPIPHAEEVDAIPPELPALLRQEGHPELQAVQLDVAHGFGEQGLHRLEANIQPDNARSIASVRRLGFRREAFSPRYLRIGGEWRDHERWALPTDE